MDKVNSIEEAAEEIDTFLENLISENFKGLFGEIIKDGDLAWFYRENIKQACIEFNQWQQSQQPEIGNNDSDGVELNATDFAEFTELEGYHIKGMDNGQRAAIYKLFKQSKL